MSIGKPGRLAGTRALFVAFPIVSVARFLLHDDAGRLSGRDPGQAPRRLKWFFGECYFYELSPQRADSHLADIPDQRKRRKGRLGIDLRRPANGAGSGPGPC